MFEGISHGVEIWIVVSLIVLAALFLINGMARLYRKAGPHEALIVYGLGGTRIVKGHGTMVLPMVQVCDPPGKEARMAGKHSFSGHFSCSENSISRSTYQSDWLD